MKKPRTSELGGDRCSSAVSLRDEACGKVLSKEVIQSRQQISGRQRELFDLPQ